MFALIAARERVMAIAPSQGSMIWDTDAAVRDMAITAEAILRAPLT